MIDFKMILNCRKCLSELPPGQSMKTWSKTQTGITTNNEVAVWCNRHNELVGVITKKGKILPQLLVAKCAMCEAGVPHHYH